MRFSRIYNVRSSEITPEYKLKEFYIGMYFQECFAEYMASKGLAAYDLAKSGQTWLTSDVQIDYLQEMPFWREPVEMQVWVRQISAIRIYVDFEAIHKSSVIARGSSIQLIAEKSTHHPIKNATIASISSLSLIHESALPGVEFKKIDPFGGEYSKTSQVVRYDDLDFNMHLNNVKYVPRALESIPQEFRNSHTLKEYRIKFMRETFFNNTVSSEAFRDGNRIFHRLARVEDGVELCRMESLWE